MLVLVGELKDLRVRQEMTKSAKQRIQGNRSFVLGPGDFVPPRFTGNSIALQSSAPTSAAMSPGQHQRNARGSPRLTPAPSPGVFPLELELMRLRRQEEDDESSTHTTLLLPPLSREPLLLRHG